MPKINEKVVPLRVFGVIGLDREAVMGLAGLKFGLSFLDQKPKPDLVHRLGLIALKNFASIPWEVGLAGLKFGLSFLDQKPKPDLVHRLGLIALKNFASIPWEVKVSNRCHNILCINPDHLSLSSIIVKFVKQLVSILSLLSKIWNFLNVCFSYLCMVMFPVNIFISYCLPLVKSDFKQITTISLHLVPYFFFL